MFQTNNLRASRDCFGKVLAGRLKRGLDSIVGGSGGLLIEISSPRERD